MKRLKESSICVIGLGYVGLPLAVELSKKYKVTGFDINPNRIRELKSFFDSTLEVEERELRSVDIEYTSAASDIEEANVYIVTVPTPILDNKTPDLGPLESASALLGDVINKGDVVIYESTVYPGATDEICVPVLESKSGLVFNRDFFVGYSPERINPGDKQHRLPNIKKVTSGSTDEVADFVDELYASIILAGTHKASSIKVAEAAKVIENTQRDLNIALINELSIIFNMLGIDTEEVLEAAGTKWNFLPFRPGLVGGHCIGVDPYYLTHKAQEVGYFPEVILSGRRINDGMGRYIASQLIKKMVKSSIQVKSSNVLVMGLAFKENCPDLRNTKVVDVISELKEYGALVDVFDPWARKEDALSEFGIELIEEPAKKYYDAILVAVAHDVFMKFGEADIRGFCKPESIVYDLKYVLGKEGSDLRL